jgi:hypothetical protein
VKKPPAAARDATDREMADAIDPLMRLSVLEFTENGRIWKGFLFAPFAIDQCVVFAVVGIRGGKVRGKLYGNGRANANPPKKKERITLDAAELECDGRAWCRAHHGFVYAHPMAWPMWKAWQDEREAGRTQQSWSDWTAAKCDGSSDTPPGRAELSRFGLAEGATAEDVRRAFRKMVVTQGLHPDHGGDMEAFKDLSTACDLAVAFVESW